MHAATPCSGNHHTGTHKAMTLEGTVSLAAYSTCHGLNLTQVAPCSQPQSHTGRLFQRQHRAIQTRPLALAGTVPRSDNFVPNPRPTVDPTAPEGTVPEGFAFGGSQSGHFAATPPPRQYHFALKRPPFNSLALEGSVPAGVAIVCPRGGLFAAMPPTQLNPFGPHHNGTASEAWEFRCTIRTGERDCFHFGCLPIGHQVAIPQVRLSNSVHFVLHPKHDHATHELFPPPQSA